MTSMNNQVFENLFRDELAYTPPYIDIKFFTKYMQGVLNESTDCGVETIKMILQLIQAE